MILAKDTNGNISYVNRTDGQLPHGYTALTQAEIDSYNLQRYATMREALYRTIAALGDMEAEKYVYIYPQIERDSWPTIRDEAQKLVAGTITSANAQFVLDDAIRATGNPAPTDAEIIAAAQSVLVNSATYRAALHGIKTNVRILQSQVAALQDSELENYTPVWPV